MAHNVASRVALLVLAVLVRPGESYYDGGGAGCSTSNPCNTGEFCNFDAVSSGSCESCSDCASDCYGCGLPDEGASDCESRCNAPSEPCCQRVVATANEGFDEHLPGCLGTFEIYMDDVGNGRPLYQKTDSSNYYLYDQNGYWECSYFESVPPEGELTSDIKVAHGGGCPNQVSSRAEGLHAYALSPSLTCARLSRLIHSLHAPRSTRIRITSVRPLMASATTGCPIRGSLSSASNNLPPRLPNHPPHQRRRCPHPLRRLRRCRRCRHHRRYHRRHHQVQAHLRPLLPASTLQSKLGHQISIDARSLAAATASRIRR